MASRVTVNPGSMGRNGSVTRVLNEPFMIHAIARITVAFIWIWHGLLPKLLFLHVDELVVLTQAGVPLHWSPWIGGGKSRSDRFG